MAAVTITWVTVTWGSQAPGWVCSSAGAVPLGAVGPWRSSCASACSASSAASATGTTITDALARGGEGRRVSGTARDGGEGSCRRLLCHRLLWPRGGGGGGGGRRRPTWPVAEKSPLGPPVAATPSMSAREACRAAKAASRGRSASGSS
jgi:hypothetical protein